MSYETIRYDVADRIATITLNRPERLNAFNAQMQAELLSVFDEIDADDEVRAVIVTGEGRGFCAGADLEAGGAQGVEEGSHLLGDGSDVRDRAVRIPVEWPRPLRPPLLVDVFFDLVPQDEKPASATHGGIFDEILLLRNCTRVSYPGKRTRGRRELREGLRRLRLFFGALRNGRG